MIKFTTAISNIKKLREHFEIAVSQDKINLDMSSFFEIDDHGFEYDYDDDPVDQDYPSSIFANIRDEQGNEIINKCNSSCCMVGFAVISGEEDFAPLQDDDEYWDDYAERLFINDYHSPCFDFLFGGSHPNIKEASLYRLDRAIEKMDELCEDVSKGDEALWADFKDYCRVWDRQIDDDEFYPPQIQKLI